MNDLKIKRVYEPEEEQDGYRILIDRLWPRGVSKNNAAIDEWNRDIAPTAGLRKWFSHREERYVTFADQYQSELNANPAAEIFAEHCKNLLSGNPVTLLYGAKSKICNHAIVLRDWILNFWQ